MQDCAGRPGGGAGAARRLARAGEDSLGSPPSRRPPTPRPCRARGASKPCARRPLVPRRCQCAGARAPSRPDPQPGIAETSAPPRAASTSTPGDPGSPWAHRTRTREGGGAHQDFHFFNKTVPLTGRSLGAGLGRGRPRGRHLLPLAEPAARRGRGDHRALTPAGLRAPLGGAPASLHLAAPQRLSSAAPTTMFVWREGGFSLCSVLRAQTSSAAPGHSPISSEARKMPACP